MKNTTTFKMKLVQQFVARQGGAHGILWEVSADTLEDCQALAKIKFDEHQKAGHVQLPALFAIVKEVDSAPIEAEAFQIVRDVADSLARGGSDFRDKMWRRNARKRLQKSFDYDLMAFASPVK